MPLTLWWPRLCQISIRLDVSSSLTACPPDYKWRRCLRLLKNCNDFGHVDRTRSTHQIVPVSVLKPFEGMEVQLHPLLNSPLRWTPVVSCTSRRRTLGETAPGGRWVGSWVVPETDGRLAVEINCACAGNRTAVPLRQ